MTRLDKLEERIAELEIEVYEEVSVLESTLNSVRHRVQELEKKK